IALSHAPSATFEFNCGPTTLHRTVVRAEFEGWIQSELAAIGGSVDRLLTTAGIRPTEIDHVFLTGGSAFVPAVRQLFIDR
ncbi:Hsp70 family protein, partial [Staphylococcus aureus]